MRMLFERLERHSPFVSTSEKMLMQTSTRSPPNGSKENTHSSKEEDVGPTWRNFTSVVRTLAERNSGYHAGWTFWSQIKKDREDKRDL